MRQSVGLNINAGALFMTATAAYLISVARAPAPFSIPFRGNYALVAVVIVAASLEGLLNELGALSGQEESESTPVIGQFATVAAEAEAGHASPSLKFQLAYLTFAGKAFDRGQQPYHDFDLLFAIRNAVMHLKEDPAYLTGPGGELAVPKLAKRLMSRGVKLNAPVKVDELGGAYIGASIASLLSTPEVARWACETAANMAQAICRVIPASNDWPSLSQIVDLHYTGTFVVAWLDDPT